MLKKICTIGLIISILIFLGFVGYLQHKTYKQNLASPIPKEAISQIIVTRTGVQIRRQQEADQVIPIPKSGEIVIETRKNKVEIQKPSWMPQLVYLPQFGLSLSKVIEPQLGIQWVRIEPLKIGLSVGITPSSLSLSLDRDILTNAYIGIFYGINRDVTTCIGLRLGFFF